MNLVYKIKDKLHLTLFWYTYNKIKKMRIENNDYKRMLILYKLIRKVWKCFYPEAVDDLKIDMKEIELESNWETILTDLDYYSDRWGWHRLNRIILMYNEMNNSKYCFMKPKLNFYGDD